MKKVIVASQNPVKVQAVLMAFQTMFPQEQFEVIALNVSSGVAGQPMSDEETLKGAINRAEAAFYVEPEADFWVGLEGGLQQKPEGLMTSGWAVVRSLDGYYGKGRSANYFLPPRLVELIKQGKELSEADDIVFGREGSKLKDGAVGLLTENVIDRLALSRETVVMALIPFKNQGLYFSEKNQKPKEKKVDLAEYQKFCQSVAKSFEQKETEIMDWGLGIAGEAGDVAGCIKKTFCHGNDQTKGIRENLGDTMWYIAMICNFFGWDLNEVMLENVAKLSQRYPSGFTEQEAKRNNSRIDWNEK